MNRLKSILLFLVLFSDEPLYGATLTVTSSGDVTLNDDLTTLREAVQQANSMSGKDTIVMSENLTMGITLTQGQIAISDEVEIDGTYFPPPVIGKGTDPKIVFSAPIRVEQDALDRIFNIAGGLASVEIRNMVVFSGNATRIGTTIGGGILMGAGSDVTLRNVTIQECKGVDGGAGIWSSGSNLTMIGCRVIDNLSGNESGGKGGGINATGGELNLMNCMIEENSLRGSGGFDQGGGGVYLDGAIGHFTNTTFQRNSGYTHSGGGMFLINGAVLNVTGGELLWNRAEDGAGIHAEDSSELRLAGTVIRENTATRSGGGLYNKGAATIVSSTIELNASNSSSFNVGGGGIYNRGVVTIVGSQILNNRITSTGTGGGILNLTIGAMIFLEDSVVEGNQAGGIGGGVTISSGTVEMKKCLVADNVSLNRGGGVYLSVDCQLCATETLFIDNRIPNIGPDMGGGGICNFGDCFINNCTFESNISMGYIANDNDLGGGAAILNGRLAEFEMIDSRVVGNQASTDFFGPGGGIHNYGVMTVAGGRIDGNTAEIGGGISVRSGTMTLDNVLVDSNIAGFSGGGIRANVGSHFIMNGGSVIGNSARIGGGLVVNGDPDIPDGGVIAEVNGTLISGNLVDASGESFRGGGGVVNLGTLILANATVEANTAMNLGEDSGGGGIFNIFELHAVDSLVFGNTVIGDQSEGGGIYNTRGANATFHRSEIRDNTAEKGGGIFNIGNLQLVASTLVDNSALTHGGGLYNASGTTRFDSSTLHGNLAIAGDGGAIHSVSGTTRIINSTVSGNQATAGSGGGIASVDQDSEIELVHGTVASNHAATNGGGVFVSQGAVRAGNTLIANNTASQSSPDLFGTLNSLDFNLIGDTSNSTLAGPIANSILDVNPMVGPIADNGGPTLTHNLLVGSPAIDAGSSGLSMSEGLTEDQRGFTRIADIGSIPNADGGVDIGAVEIIAIETDDEIAFENDGQIEFTVSLSHAPVPGEQATVRFDTASVEGGAAATDDFTPISNGLLTFNSSGPFAQVISVSIIDDTTSESNEEFQIVLTEAFGATILDATALGTIVDDDNSTPTTTPTPTEGMGETPTPTPNYDVRPIPPDGIVNALDLIEWHTRIGDGSPEARILFDFARFWGLQ